jgi:hypothetical protein
MEASSDPVADRRSVRSAFRPCAARGRRRTGLLGLLVSVSCGVPGAAMASTTFTGNPLADGWTLLGNSSSDAFRVRGTNSFDIFTKSFNLAAGDVVNLGGAGFPQGDAFLYGGTTDSWKVGNKILGLGISNWASGAGGYPNPAKATSSGLFYVKFDPAGTGVFGNNDSVPPKSNNDLSIYQSPGSFGFDFNRGTQNSSPQVPVPPYQPYQTFELQGVACATAVPAPCDSTSYPYANGSQFPRFALAGNGNNLSTTATGTGTLPMRAFGLRATSETSWSSFEIFINTDLLPAGAGTFGDNSKFSFSAFNFLADHTVGFAEAAGCLNPSGCTAPAPPQTGPEDNVPGPLPLLGVGAAFGYSRRLRRRIKSTGPSV